MRIDVITLFPDMFKSPFEETIMKRAIDQGNLELHVHQLRNWATDKHQLTDDRPFGGGPGMVLMPDPLFKAIEELTQFDADHNKISKVILLTPSGEPLKQHRVQQLSQEKHLLLICGRYEGVDQRVIDSLVDLQISIGDYVLSGGELPAMVLIDSIVRLIPGVLGTAESLDNESFNQPLLDYPQYTQPAEYHGMEVPEVLRSGDHGRIAKWRLEQSEKLTREVRPDLWEMYNKTEDAK